MGGSDQIDVIGAQFLKLQVSVREFISIHLHAEARGASRDGIVLAEYAA